jgi:hypothetical protein
MKTSKFTEEQITMALRQAEVGTAMVRDRTSCQISGPRESARWSPRRGHVSLAEWPYA